MALRLNKKNEYALAGLYYLAFVKPRQFVQVRTIANEIGVPKRFLEQIFLVLRERKFLESKRGSQGGYRLAMPPEQISLSSLFEILEGYTEPPPAELAGSGADYYVWRSGHLLWDYLKQMSMADIMDEDLKHHLREQSRKTAMYYI